MLAALREGSAAVDVDVAGGEAVGTVGVAVEIGSGSGSGSESSRGVSARRRKGGVGREGLRPRRVRSALGGPAAAETPVLLSPLDTATRDRPLFAVAAGRSSAARWTLTAATHRLSSPVRRIVHALEIALAIAERESAATRSAGSGAGFESG